FRDRRAVRERDRSRRPSPQLRPDDVAASVGAGRSARADLPCSQDSRRRALPPLMSTPKPSLDGLRAALERAVRTLADPPAAPSLERPKQAEHGDFSTNAAMMLAKPLGRSPREIGAELEQAIAKELGSALAKSEI